MMRLIQGRIYTVISQNTALQAIRLILMRAVAAVSSIVPGFSAAEHDRQDDQRRDVKWNFKDQLLRDRRGKIIGDAAHK